MSPQASSTFQPLFPHKVPNPCVFLICGDAIQLGIKADNICLAAAWWACELVWEFGVSEDFWVASVGAEFCTFCSQSWFPKSLMHVCLAHWRAWLFLSSSLASTTTVYGTCRVFRMVPCLHLIRLVPGVLKLSSQVTVPSNSSYDSVFNRWTLMGFSGNNWYAGARHDWSLWSKSIVVQALRKIHEPTNALNRTSFWQFKHVPQISFDHFILTTRNIVPRAQSSSRSFQHLLRLTENESPVVSAKWSRCEKYKVTSLVVEERLAMTWWTE